MEYYFLSIELNKNHIYIFALTSNKTPQHNHTVRAKLEDSKMAMTDSELDTEAIIEGLERAVDFDVYRNGTKFPDDCTRSDSRTRKIWDGVSELSYGNHVGIERVHLFGTYIHSAITIRYKGTIAVVHFQPQDDAGTPDSQCSEDQHKRIYTYTLLLPQQKILTSPHKQTEESKTLFIYEYKDGLAPEHSERIAMAIQKSRNYHLLKWNCESLAVYCRTLRFPPSLLAALTSFKGQVKATQYRKVQTTHLFLAK